MRRRGIFRMRFLADRRGTAEVVGSILFIIILLFLFTNVYLWNDAAVKNAQSMNIKQMNAGMILGWDATSGLSVKAERSDVSLYRVWLTDDGGDHYYAEMDGQRVAAGETRWFARSALDFKDADGNSVSVDVGSRDRLTVVNTLGIKAEFTVP